MTALLHKLCLDTFHHHVAGACLEVVCAAGVLPDPAGGPEGQPAGQGDRGAARGLEGRFAEGRGRALGLARRPRRRPAAAALLAHCVSFGVNALYEKADRYGGPGISVHGVQRRLAQADRLAQCRRPRHGRSRLAADRRQLSRPRAPSPASSRRCARRRARTRRSSSTT